MNNDNSSAKNKKKLEKSLTRLYDIYKDISFNADEISKYRCPYKNAQSKCTANFQCRNQYFQKNDKELAICTGSDKLDYRSAWNVDQHIKND
tara:strand:+ start:1598 stop:1873 length:276 start_codon:yes stop_codon:yes gene_type:complete